jgi:hypothetical protein
MNKIGVLIALRANTDIAAEFKKAQEIGCECCQLTVWDTSLYTAEKAAEVRSAAEECGMTVYRIGEGVTLDGLQDFLGFPQ